MDDVRDGKLGPRAGLRLSRGLDQHVDGRAGPVVRGVGLGEGQGPVGLRPGPGGVARQGEVLQLGPGQAGLDLQIGGAGTGQPALPVVAAGGGAPAEQLPAPQPGVEVWSRPWPSASTAAIQGVSDVTWKK
ncbi:hypothetical protein [Nonomuraea dietziae]|uniref:hypothetical protein n=1 Tax=Nonomuraea dietziae TaxID=65515 RepID=UPI0031CF40A5